VTVFGIGIPEMLVLVALIALVVWLLSRRKGS
jgi:hypothetical protein